MFLNEIILSLILLINVSICDERKRQYFVRKSAKDYTYNDWEDYRRGLTVMKARDPLDPTSFDYQANIHAWPEYDGSRQADAIAKKYNWHQSQHFQYWFPIWHRMFIYFFERILRKASGNPRFALPYWEYDSDSERQMPQPFRLPANETTNVLYSRLRCQWVNDGLPLARAQTDCVSSLKSQFFSTNKYTNELNVCHSFAGGATDEPMFDSNRGGAIDWVPHASVHDSIGGPTGLFDNICTAFRDPIFLIHHTQIERIWHSWTRLGGPVETDNHYLNQTFGFYDENRLFGTYYVKDFNDISRLDYKYDKLIDYERVKPLANDRPVLHFSVDISETLVITNRNSSIVFDIKPKYLPFYEQIGKGLFDKDRVKFTMQVVYDARTRAGFTLQLYLNLPPGQQPYEDSKYFIATQVELAVDCTPLNNRRLLNINRCFDITDTVFAIMTDSYKYNGFIPNRFNMTAVPTVCGTRYESQSTRKMITFTKILVIHYFIE